MSEWQNTVWILYDMCTVFNPELFSGLGDVSGRERVFVQEQVLTPS